MHLVAPLASGVAGAENGYVRILQRATSTPATCYTSFEGTAVISQPSAGIPLDARGGLEVYVNQLVDVLVTDADGTEVVNFTAGDSAPNVEVRSLSFTGNDYQSGASLAGYPTTLQEVLDLVRTAFGTTNWNITVGGVTRTPASWLASIAGIFTNVKDPSYGAVGDGVTDDTSHIQAALTAATSGKSIVFFPAGTYRIVSKLTIPVGVSLWGAGTEATFIKMDHATNDSLEYGATASTGLQELRGITLDTLQANTGSLVRFTAGSTRRVHILNCSLGTATTIHTGACVSVGTAAAILEATDCDIFASTDNGIYCPTEVGKVILRNCRFKVVGSAYSNSLAALLCQSIVTGCEFDMSAVSSGTGVCLTFGSATPTVGSFGSVSGCIFTPGTSVNLTAILIVGANDANSRVYEVGNSIKAGFSVGVGGLTNITAAAAEAVSTWRDPRIEQLATNANVTMTGDTHGITLITRSTNAAGQVLASNVGPPGCHYTVGVLNSSGGNIAAAGISFGVGFIATVPAFPVGAVLATGKTMWYHFRSCVVGGTAFWTPVAANIQGV